MTAKIRKLQVGIFAVLIMSVGYLGMITTAISANLLTDPQIKLFAKKPPKLSFYFQNIELRALLQLIGKNSGLNFVISDLVKGNVTLSLKDVTWRQALAIILQSQGLASRQDGNVMYISTIESITSNEAKELQAQDQLANLAPLSSVIITLKYTNATELANLLKGAQSSLLTSRGQVAVDTRTNSIILRDTKKNIREIAKAIKKIDIPARQVLIEANIVNIDTTYEEQLGVRFGVTSKNHLSGTFQGANQITSGVTPSQVADAAGTVDPLKRLNFNVPANQLFDGQNPGSIALALARIGPVMLDWELSALEGEQHAKIIARPRIVTSNGQKARIQTGEEIPYQEATSSGATSVSFKNAVLSLEIIPQITPDNKIMLNLKATEDSRGQNTAVGTSSTAGTTQVPAINTQEVQSNVLLNDNETVVIGGIYKKVKQDSWDRVPFLGELPIVGYLFRHKGEHDENHELLIFITPKIITASNNNFKSENYK